MYLLIGISANFTRIQFWLSLGFVRLAEESVISAGDIKCVRNRGWGPDSLLVLIIYENKYSKELYTLFYKYKQKTFRK
jgi:hypothetical protein